MDELVEVVIGAEPFRPFGEHQGVEILHGIHLGLALVEEAVLLVDERQLPLCADGLGLLHLGGIDAAILRSVGISCNVDAQVFPPALFASAGILDGGVEVQVEGDLPAGVVSFSKCYFYAAHNCQLFFLLARMLSTSSRMKYTKFPRLIRGTLCSLKTQ